MNSRLDLLRRKVAAWLLLPGAWISPRHMRFWVIALILTYTLSGFLLLPWIVESPRSSPGSVKVCSGRYSWMNCAMPRLLIEELVFAEGVVRFTDHVPDTRFDTEFGPINIVVHNLSSLPDDEGQQQVVIQTEKGETLGWSGSLQLHPLHSAGRVVGGGSYVPLWYRYYQDILAIEAPVGIAQLGFDYEIGNDDGGNFTASIDNLDFAVRDLVVKSDQSGTEIFYFPETRISGGWLR